MGASPLSQAAQLSYHVRHTKYPAGFHFEQFNIDKEVSIESGIQGQSYFSGLCWYSLGESDQFSKLIVFK